MARSCVSATVSRPIGLSSRTTSPVSVTHDVVCSPLKDSSTRNAGSGRSLTRTSSRRPTSTRPGHSASSPDRTSSTRAGRLPGARRWPDAEPRLSISAGGSDSVRTSVRVRPPLVIGKRQRQPIQGAAHAHRAGAGVQREVEGLEGERAVHSRRGANGGRARGAEQRHLEPAVLLQLEPVIGRDDLADGEANLLAAVVDAAPLCGRAVTREVGGEVGRRGHEVGAVHEHRHATDPGQHDQPGERPREASGSGRRKVTASDYRAERDSGAGCRVQGAECGAGCMGAECRVHVQSAECGYPGPQIAS